MRSLSTMMSEQSHLALQGPWPPIYQLTMPKTNRRKYWTCHHSLRPLSCIMGLPTLSFTVHSILPCFTAFVYNILLVCFTFFAIFSSPSFLTWSACASTSCGSQAPSWYKTAEFNMNSCIMFEGDAANFFSWPWTSCQDLSGLLRHTLLYSPLLVIHCHSRPIYVPNVVLFPDIFRCWMRIECMTDHSSFISYTGYLIQCNTSLVVPGRPSIRHLSL